MLAVLAPEIHFPAAALLRAESVLYVCLNNRNEINLLTQAHPQ